MSEVGEKFASNDSGFSSWRSSKRPHAVSGVAAATAAAARKRRNVRYAQTDAHETSCQRTVGGQAPGAKRECQDTINALERPTQDEDGILDVIEKIPMDIPPRFKVHTACGTGFVASPARPGTPKQPGSPCIAKGAMNKPSNLNGRARPTNNQLLYKAHFRWSHYKGHSKERAESTEACASVTSAFLQVLREIYVAEREHRNILQILSGNTRRTKMVALASGSHRVPEELRRHSLGDDEGNEYSTNLDRNRYGNDDQYLSTVIRYDLEFLGLCPALVDVEIIDAKSRDASTIISVGEQGCTCKGGGRELYTSSKSSTMSLKSPSHTVRCGVGAARTSVARVSSGQMLGGIGMLLDVMGVGAEEQQDSDPTPDASDADGSEASRGHHTKRLGSEGETDEARAVGSKGSLEGGATLSVHRPLGPIRKRHRSTAPSDCSGENESETRPDSVLSENRKLRELLRQRSEDCRNLQQQNASLLENIGQLERCNENLEALVQEMKKEGNSHALTLELDGARQHISDIERSCTAHANEVERLSQELRRRDAWPASPFGMSATAMEAVALRAQVTHLSQCLERSEFSRLETERMAHALSCELESLKGSNVFSRQEGTGKIEEEFKAVVVQTGFSDVKSSQNSPPNSETGETQTCPKPDTPNPETVRSGANSPSDSLESQQNHFSLLHVAAAAAASAGVSEEQHCPTVEKGGTIPLCLASNGTPSLNVQSKFNDAPANMPRVDEQTHAGTMQA